MEKNSVILITGGQGMLGTHTKKILSKLGYEHILSPTKDELNLLDLKNTEQYLTEKKPDFIFHFAGLVYGLGGNLNNQIDAIYKNSLINLNLLYALRSLPIRKIFFAGTVASYPFPYESLPLKEEQMFLGKPHQGEYGYAVAKNLGYHFLELLQKEIKLDYCIGLFTNLFGEHDKFDDKNAHVVPSLIYKIYHAIQQKTPLEVWGSGEATRDFLYVSDAAKAAIFLMDNFSGMINISSGKESSIQELVSDLTKVSNFTGEVAWQKNAPTGIPARSVDNSKLRNLGFDDFTNYYQALNNTYQWFNDSQNKL